MEALKVADANLMVYIHPSKSNRIQQAVRQQLSSSLFTFDEIFDGVLLAYSFELLSKNAKILPGLIPYLGVNIKAKLLLFSPQTDMLLDGKVAKLTKESIHVIVLGICSVAITLEDIREEFEYRIKGGLETFVSTAHKRHVLKQGTMLRFSVKSFDEEILHISGSLASANTGSIRWLFRHGGEDLQIQRSAKRQRTRHTENDMETGKVDHSTPQKKQRTA